MVRGNPSEALHHSDLALKQMMAAGSVFEPIICLVLKARVLHGLGRDAEAVACLAQTQREARRLSSPLIEFYASMAEAEFSFDRGKDADGLAALRLALGLGREHRYLNSFVDVPTTTAKVCARALEAGIEVEYVQEIIRKRHLVLVEPPYQLETWPWALRVYTLGSFRLEKDGNPVTFSGKVQQKPLLLLKALIALGGEATREAQVSDALWPEAEGDAAHNAFTTTLSRLRDLLGVEQAIRLQDDRVSLDPRACWVDAWAFERLLGEAEDRLKHLGEGQEPDGLRRPALADLVAKATGLYQDHFLPGDEAHGWAAACRERLRAKFLRLMGRWGEHLEGLGRWQDAVACYQRAQEVDDLAEEFYQHLMGCYHQLGLRAEALAVYRRCQQVLSSTLGVTPSSKTEHIYRSLLA